ncbi:hypothetical protein [Vibrio mediterranei]|uniref:hypothetical protein n=1 Tax=Vibrio mediterranei TaxID=689 RepID=UPI004067D4E8
MLKTLNSFDRKVWVRFAIFLLLIQSVIAIGLFQLSAEYLNEYTQRLVIEAKLDAAELIKPHSFPYFFDELEDIFALYEAALLAITESHDVDRHIIDSIISEHQRVTVVLTEVLHSSLKPTSILLGAASWLFTIFSMCAALLILSRFIKREKYRTVLVAIANQPHLMLMLIFSYKIVINAF